MILEAFAERIVRLGAHRSSWRNGISEGSHKSFCSQPIVGRLHTPHHSSGRILLQMVDKRILKIPNHLHLKLRIS